MYEKYEKLTGGALSGYISELTLKGYADNEIAILLCNRWAYLFGGLSYFEWSQIVEEYRSTQKCGDFPNEHKARWEYYSGGKLVSANEYYGKGR